MERLRTDPGVYVEWAETCNSWVAWAVKHATTHRIGFLFDCDHEPRRSYSPTNTPHDWFLHVPTCDTQEHAMYVCDRWHVTEDD